MSARLVRCRACHGRGRYYYGECLSCYGRGEIASDFARLLALGRVRRMLCDGCGHMRSCAERDDRRYCAGCWIRIIHPELVPTVRVLDAAELPF